MRRAPIALILFALAACRGPAEGNDTAGNDQPAWQGPPAEAAPTGKLSRAHAGTPAPEAEFEDPDGEPASLADFRGRPLLLNLWATWCAPCVAEMPTLDALAAREKGRLQVLTVSEDVAGRDKVESWFAKQDFRMLETWRDPEMRLMAELKVDTLPTTILYDADGRELWRVTGMEDWESGRTAVLLREAERASPAAAR